MKDLQYSHQKYINVRKTSKSLFFSLIILGFLRFPIESVFEPIFTIILLLVGIHMSVAGLFIFVVPWISQAWLAGINVFIPEKPWNEQSKRSKFVIYVSSLGLLIGGSLIFVFTIIEVVNKSI